MSRHTIPARQPRLDVAVGWDDAMRTYFAQVEDPDGSGEADDLLLWIGTLFGEISDPRAMVRPLAPYAALTPEHLATLLRDRDGGMAPPSRAWRLWPFPSRRAPR